MKGPDRIYLQYDGDVHVTWCADRINDEDVEYVRAAAPVAVAGTGERERLIEMIDAAFEGEADQIDVLRAIRDALAAPAPVVARESEGA